jgi:hypothetical protein
MKSPHFRLYNKIGIKEAAVAHADVSQFNSFSVVDHLNYLFIVYV